MVKQLNEGLVKHNTYVCPTLLVLKRNYYIEEMFKEPHLDYLIPIMPYHRYFKYMQNPFGRYIGLRQMKKYYPVISFTGEEKKQRDEGFQKILEFTKLLSENGVKIIIGTDAINPSIVPGFSVHQELKLFVETGISPLDALRYATSIPTELLNKTNMGVIKPNAYANLLLIDGNPIEDIEELSKIKSIILKGKLFNRKELAEKINSYE